MSVESIIENAYVFPYPLSEQVPELAGFILRFVRMDRRFEDVVERADRHETASDLTYTLAMNLACGVYLDLKYGKVDGSHYEFCEYVLYTTSPERKVRAHDVADSYHDVSLDDITDSQIKDVRDYVDKVSFAQCVICKFADDLFGKNKGGKQ